MKGGSIFPAGNGVFAYDCFDSTRACTYDQLRTLLNDDLGGIDAATRVAVVMRNGADLALALQLDPTNRDAKVRARERARSRLPLRERSLSDTATRSASSRA